MDAIRSTLVIVAIALALVTTVGPGGSEPPRAPSARLEDVSVVAQGDLIAVRLKTSQPRRYRTELIDGPYRLVLDLEDTAYAWRRVPLITAAGPLVQIRGSQYRRDTARVVLELKSRVPYSIVEEGDSLIVVLGVSAGPASTGVAAKVTTSVDGGAEPARPTDRPLDRPPGRPMVAQAAPPPPPPRAPAPAAVPPPSPAPTADPTAAREQLISLEFKDAEVVNLLRILAAESGRNIVIGDDVKGRMSISLRNVPWTLALQTILETRGLERLDRDGVIRIVSLEQLTREREARARVEEAKSRAEIDIRTKRAEAELREQEAQGRKRAAEAAVAEAIARGPLVEEAIRLAYADPGDIANTLQGLLGLERFTDVKSCRGDENEPAVLRSAAIRGPIAEPPFSQLFGPPPQAQEPPPPRPAPVPLSVGITVNCATNTIFLRLYANELERMKRLIRESLDIPAPQVKIEARMEILERDDLFAIGIQWGGGGVTTANGNAIVGRGFTSELTNLPQGGIPPAGLPPLNNPNLGLGQSIPVSSQSGLPLGGNVINLPIGSLLQGAASAGAAGIAFGIIGSRFNLNLALEALRAQGKTFTLARPDIVTLENRRARISLGEEIPYATVSSAGTQVQFKLAVLQLVVIPTVVRIVDRNRIKMSVIVENNSRGTAVNLGTSGSPPAINRRRAETEVIVNDGDHLVIGGVTTGTQREDIRKVPGWGDIPVLGWLFKQRGTQELRRELVVFITPTVLRGESGGTPPPPRPVPPPTR